MEGFFWVDIILHFFQAYKDQDTYKIIKSHKKIAYNYVLRGTFIVDFISAFPFVPIFGGDAILTKLFRLFRLPKLISLLDISRMSTLLKKCWSSQSRDERIRAQYRLMYVYKIFRLIVLASILTYFLGCLWFLISKEVNPSDVTATFADDSRFTTRDPSV